MHAFDGVVASTSREEQAALGNWCNACCCTTAGTVLDASSTAKDNLVVTD